MCVCVCVCVCACVFVCVYMYTCVSRKLIALVQLKNPKFEMYAVEILLSALTASEFTDSSSKKSYLLTKQCKEAW